MTLPPPTFEPPSAEQVRTHLRRCTPTRPTNFNVIMLLVCLGVLLLVWEIMQPGWLSLLVVWMVIAGYIGWRVNVARQARQLQDDVRAVFELALLRQTHEALRRAWRLLPRLYRSPTEHGQVVSVMSSCLMRVRAYEPAAETCDYLLEFVPPQHPAGHFIRLQRVLAYLHLDRLVDADDEIRTLRNADLGAYETAVLTTATLYQQIKTNHHDDATAAADNAVQQLHPLGAEAAYGYGLIASAFRQRGDDAQAQQWWRRATMLIPGHAIAYDLPETAPLLGLSEGVRPPFGATRTLAATRAASSTPPPLPPHIRADGSDTDD